MVLGPHVAATADAQTLTFLTPLSRTCLASHARCGPTAQTLAFTDLAHQSSGQQCTKAHVGAHVPEDFCTLNPFRELALLVKFATPYRATTRGGVNQQ
ncbi:MAG: hypothetical protein ACI9W2_001554 [Gammaproteobacteria bacterium]|jgi:hypothetical protein